MKNHTTHVLDLTADTPLEAMLQPEWLLTNQTGGYAMSTAAGCNTRRYHGLLVAAANPPVGRIVALNQVLEQLVFQDGRKLEFTTCQFRGGDGGAVFAPNGKTILKRFERGLTVKWTYKHEGITFTRELLLHPAANGGRQAITLSYTVFGLTEHATLMLSPMLTLRDFHHMNQQAWASPYDFNVMQRSLVVHHDGQAVSLACSDGRFEPDCHWWNGFHYPCDTRRGQDDQEDQIVPGRFEIDIDPQSSKTASFTLTAVLASDPIQPLKDLPDRPERISAMADHLSDNTPQMSTACEKLVGDLDRLHVCLAIAADDFVVERTVAGQKLMTILAGYPWFADWGRDTFIALPGLLLETGRYEQAASVLKAFAAVLHEGMIPNRFDDYDDSAAHYNTVDASLWFVRAALAYVEATGEPAADWLTAAVMSVLDHYELGTMNRIQMDPRDSLITAGDEHTQLTWMDAKCGDLVFTPRSGKAVEINALWYSNLFGVGNLIKNHDNTKAEHYLTLAKRVKKSFKPAFERPDGLGLFDHIRLDGTKDTSIRPNQIFAASLPNSPLPQKLAATVVKVVGEHLLTDVGLKTLPSQDPNYHPFYIGDASRRDEAYHQGTIWPWLIGGYGEALLRVGKFSQKSRRAALETIHPLMQRLLGDGLGQLHEIHEADTLFPVGSMAQAWSVSEVLRVYRLARSA